MTRGIACLLATAVFVLFAPPVEAAQKVAGTKCMKVGTVKVVNGKRHTCQKVGASRLWSKGVPLQSRVDKVPQSPDKQQLPAPPTSTNVVTEASHYVQGIINETAISAPVLTPVIRIQIEEGANGNYRKFAEEAISTTMAWFAALGMLPPQPQIDYVFGRTVGWLEQRIDEVAPGCRETAQAWQPGWKPVGSAALCTDSTRAGVYSHIVHSVVPGACCNWTDEKSASTDLSAYPLNRWVWHMIPHETFHTWQGGTGGAGAHALPVWLGEGAAQLFTYMLWAKLEGTNDAFLLLDAEEVAWQKSLCTAPIRSPENGGCNYSQGMVAMEYFIFRFGIEGNKRLWTGVSTADVHSEFQRILGVDYEEFNADLNRYLKHKGWGG